MQAGCRTSDTESLNLDTAIAETQINIIDSMTLDDVELSSVTIRSLANDDEIEILAVSDSSYKIQSVIFERKSLSKKNSFSDVDRLVGLNNKGNSQWEAVAADKQRVFMLAEGSSHVSVFDSDMKILEGTIELKISKTDKIFADWDKDTNSRGEGLVLLDNGHMLLLKEKNPVQLIEFGPQGDAAGGFKPGDGVDSKETFPFNKMVTQFVPLKHWDLGTHSQAQLSDGSDLGIGPNGKLYVLSDHSRRIVAIENVLKPTEDKFKVKQSWILPKKVEKAEGLAFTIKFEPIVVSDIANKDKNLFILSALD
jgi:hypothetical protein